MNICRRLPSMLLLLAMPLLASGSGATSSIPRRR